MGANQYNVGLDKTLANFVPLSPLSFIERSAAVYPDLPSTVYEGRTFTWAETYERCRRFASYLAGRGIGRGDTVGTMLPNTLLSGMIFPIASLPGWLRPVTYIVPARWFIVISRGIMLEGVGVTYLWKELAVLTLMLALLLVAAVRSFEPRLA